MLGVTPALEKQMELLFPQETIDRVSSADTAMETISKTINEKTIPANENLMESVDGKKQSIVKSLEGINRSLIEIQKQLKDIKTISLGGYPEQQDKKKKIEKAGWGLTYKNEAKSL